MPSKPLRFCRYPGCDNLSENSYCEEHAKLHEAQMLEARAQYSRMRESTADRGYDGRWRKARVVYLRRHPLCELCAKHGATTPAVLVHHVKPLTEGGARLDSRNFMALCRSCHERIHGRAK